MSANDTRAELPDLSHYEENRSKFPWDELAKHWANTWPSVRTAHASSPAARLLSHAPRGNENGRERLPSFPPSR